ncbi:hypothetical protein RV14_GL000975 [Enterococcus ratti]|uniref:Uncharacterized protein n=1 Tax=Enterococcus ratti TaxID=150033 RepID=A0A1L8WRT8_9ENTE|nr:hypothetical protein RV14_GL000975 [Enterococcus ratti]
MHTGVKVNRFLDNISRLLFQKIAHFALVAAVYFAGLTFYYHESFSN